MLEGSYVATTVKCAEHVTAALPRGALAEAHDGLRHVAQLERELELAVYDGAIPAGRLVGPR